MTDTDDRVAPVSVRDHLANERTLLAWMRTALTVIGLGFIVDRLAVESGETGALFTLAGITLVLLGGLVAIGGGYSYFSTRRQMATGMYRPTVALHLAAVVVVVAGALVVAGYLVWAD